jgi:hypothetical protein
VLAVRFKRQSETAIDADLPSARRGDGVGKVLFQEDVHRLDRFIPVAIDPAADRDRAADRGGKGMVGVAGIDKPAASPWDAQRKDGW